MITELAAASRQEEVDTAQLAGVFPYGTVHFEVCVAEGEHRPY